jgi:tetratricopeptide (TPR) repeat protein
VAAEMIKWLGVQASAEESTRLARADDAAPAVFEAYLRGRAAMRHLSEPNVVRAIEQFTHALAANRNHAPSLVGLAECYLLQGVTYGSIPRSKATLLAREAVGRALAIDGDHADAVNADAQLRFYLEWDGDGAERAFQRALQLSPNAEAVHQHYAMFLVARGRLDAALSQVQSALNIDPTSIPARSTLGMVWHYNGNQRQAERTFVEVLALDGRYSPARKGLVRTLLASKQYAKVLGLLDGWAQGSTDPQDRFYTAARGMALAGSGQTGEARKVADDLLASPNADGEVDAAAVLVALGDVTPALGLLEQAVAQRQSRTLFVRYDPRFEALRGNPGFTRLVDGIDFKR